LQFISVWDTVQTSTFHDLAVISKGTICLYDEQRIFLNLY